MRIVVTGAGGFMGRTLLLRLRELGQDDVVSVTRHSKSADWASALTTADVVFHLAGVNRPGDPADFGRYNADLTTMVTELLARAGRRATIVLSSSTQAAQHSPYGMSKLAAEDAVRAYAAATGARGCVLRLPNVFGKWTRPNYNSAVATFCHNIANGLPIIVHDPTAALRLVYIDDVMDTLVALLPPSIESGTLSTGPVHETTVGAVAEMIQAFRDSRASLTIPAVGTGLVRALYATYLSYLRPEHFAYPLTSHSDPRGSFSEMLRTRDSGQFSFFTAHPGITRGGHYHHTKNEKFLVVQGRARFGFRHVETDEHHEIIVDGTSPRVVETVPGWAHDVTNIGDTDMIVLLWANEAFDPAHPDTIAARVSP